MIISFEHEFVFAAVPKTGTHAVRQALRAHLGPNDIEQVGLFVQKKFPIPQLAARQHMRINLERKRDCYMLSTSPRLRRRWRALEGRQWTPLEISSSAMRLRPQ